MAKSIHQLLKSHWGFDSFRSKQQDIIESVLAGKDTLALLPTGGGKSVCFQIPGLYLGGCTLVVSPLIALMKDQVRQLKKLGINADCLVSGMSKTAIDQALDNCIYGNTKFLYVSPERLKTELFLARLPSIKCNLIAVDEAHCISQWGYDFRLDYLEVAEIRAFLPNVPIIALTATATPSVAIDIQEKLDFKSPNLIQKSFERTNLAYIIKQEEDKFYRLERLIQKTGGSGILYVQNRRKTEEYAQLLINRDVSALAYHAGLDSFQRSEAQEKWINNEVQVIVATNAFGMGIDKPDVRWVVHFDIPENPESYFQEAGRAGRDGKKSYAVLMYDQSDLAALEQSVIRKYPSKEFIRKVYDWFMNHLKVAIGSGLEEFYQFDLALFCKKYKIKQLDAMAALRLLALEGLINIPEASFELSRIKIKVSRRYFNEEESRESQMFDVLLRSYSGLFDFPTAIREPELAERLDWNLSEVQKVLRLMSKKGIVDYQESLESTSVLLTRERLKSKEINFKRADYNILKSRAIERFKAMKQLLEKRDCRSRMLLEYFGEVSNKYCGKCDYCLTQKDKAGGSDSFTTIANSILFQLENSTVLMHELLEALAKYDDLSVIKVLELLEEQDKICVEADLVSLTVKH